MIITGINHKISHIYHNNQIRPVPNQFNSTHTYTCTQKTPSIACPY